MLASPLPLGAPQGPLSVRGTPCLPAPPAQSAHGRAQLHVFLPTEAVPPVEVDSESVDEGFMDELDSKFSSLRIQQGALKTPVQWLGTQTELNHIYVHTSIQTLTMLTFIHT